MSNRFEVPSDSSPPSTPNRSSRGSSGAFSVGDNPSTTPAGPPPSSAGSFTPAGAPTASFLGSSIMRGMTSSSKPPSLLSHNPGSSSKNLFQQKRNAPLGRSIQGGPKSRQPSRLSRQFNVDDEADAGSRNNNKPGTFQMTYDESYDDDDSYDDDAEEETGDGRDGRRGSKQGDIDLMDQDAVGEDAEGDLWLDMQQNDPPYGSAPGAEDNDLMMFTTPAATERVRREAEDIARASAMQTASRRREHKFAALAKDLYTQMGYASITEPPDVVLRTEAEVARLYDDGVGASDDAEKLDDTLAAIAGRLASLWKTHADRLPHSDQEHVAEIGPGPHATPFEKANYLANLALQIHHTRLDGEGDLKTEPLPETLFRWLSDYHNLYPNQFENIERHRPSPACHGLFWQGVFIALLRGDVADARSLLANAGWDHVRRGHRGEYAYAGQVLANVEKAVRDTCDMLSSCPGADGNWEIGTSDWTLFRIRTKGALEHLRRFAEGRDHNLADSAISNSPAGRQSLAGLARQAESRVPWEIYENLNIVFEIVLGSQTAILETAQDWCEATIGLFGWWDEGGKKGDNIHPSHSQNLLLASSHLNESEAYLDRLAKAFQTAVDSDFHFNSLNPVEVGMACIFEDNAKGIIGILRSWSLPIASAVAEIASLGGWLPQHQPSGLFAMDDLDLDDLEVLGMDPGSPDEMDGVKDNTLIRYAQELAGWGEVSVAARGKSTGPRDGWELAINVLGRMDSPERSEEIVGELVHGLLENLDVDSGATCEKVWRLLNELGMIPLAEETAERYGDVLARDSLQYGEAMWYYALAHRPNKVREVMNLLISYSLLQSTAYPAPSELDDHLHRLLNERNATLKKLASQDLEAAELLGKMLSGYASLRQFYELRDGGGGSSGSDPSARTSHLRRRQAAAALTGVIASADDNIRGGLYDQTRDAIVSEDFLLVLLGEVAVFVSEPDHAFNSGTSAADSGSWLDPPAAVDGPAVSLEQIDVLLKAVEDLETVGERVSSACEDFLQLVLGSAPGVLKGSTPADLMTKSTSGMAGSSSFVLAGSSLVMDRLQKSMHGGPPGGVGKGGKESVRRGWDWRTRVAAGTKGPDVLRRVRQGLAKDLARLWLEDADGGVW